MTLTPDIEGRIAAVCIGRVGELVARGRAHTTAFVKSPVDGPVPLGTLGLAGDEHAYHDHGGVDQALLIYSIDNYPFWRRELDLDLPVAGAMAENVTVEGLTEREVFIGDTFDVDGVLVQVTSPRGPCFKLGVRYGERRMARVMQDSCRTGYLMRVLAEGHLVAGQTMRLVDRPANSMTVAEAARVANRDRDDWPVVERLARIPSLADAMRIQLEARLERRDRGDDEARLYGEGEGRPTHSARS